jgi:hypothetical protein
MKKEVEVVKGDWVWTKYKSEWKSGTYLGNSVCGIYMVIDTEHGILLTDTITPFIEIKVEELTDNQIEELAWINPCLSRKDVYDLFENVFKTKRLTFDKTYAISASIEIRNFQNQLREIAKQNMINILNG